MHFAFWNRKVEIFKDGLAIDGDIEVFYFERVHKIGEFRMVSVE
jgi:putative transposon-encoded protein